MLSLLKLQINKKLRASIFGNILEWYEFGLFGFFALVLSQHFFPSDNPYIALIAIFGAFAIGFLSRPLGALIFGYYGDKIGRKNALLYSIVIMTFATAGIGLLPSYETIGVMAPIALVLLRILQGISGGGEFTGSLVLITEFSPANKRGYYGSFSYSKIVTINSINMLILICLIPFFGYLSDKIGRKLLVMIGTILTAVTAYPVFTAMLSQSLFIIFLIQLACAISLALILGPIPALLSEQFYTSTRYTGLSFGFNTSAAILGGTTPLLCTFLVTKFANPVAPSFYLIFSALVSLTFIYLSKEKRNQLLK